MCETRISSLLGKITVLIVVVLVGSGTASGKVIYVDANALGGDNGTSWDNAYNYLQDALADANLAEKPVEIRVAQGVYTPDSNYAVPDGTGDRKATFQLINGVTLKGGYAGLGEPDPNTRDIDLYETIFSGDLNGNDGPNFANNDENSYHVVTGSGSNATAVLDGFRIISGNANGDFHVHQTDDEGGGMYTESGSPIVTNCQFSGNSASSGGGMTNIWSSNPTIDNCTFSVNYAGSGGGGMKNGWGNSKPTVTNCTFSGNFAGDTGGGMVNHNCSPILTNCTFKENSVGGGGAVCGGGGMCNYMSGSTLINCAFIENSAVDPGGGIYNHYSSPKLVNCTFSANWTETNGGGMCNGYANSRPIVTNCTFCVNLAIGEGGGIYNASGYNSGPTLTNSILWGNISGGEVDESGQIYGGGQATAINYSCIQGWTDNLGGKGNIGDDPLFVNPGYWDDRGTPEDPSDDFWLHGDYGLLYGSPCIDASDNTALPADVHDLDSDGNTTEPIPFDLDRDPRILDGDGDSVPVVDMGAYEGAHQGFLLDTAVVVVSEGGSATFTVALLMDPLGTVQVTVGHQSGDPDIVVEFGGLLMFDSTNFWIPQMVTLVATEDVDLSEGTAKIRVSSDVVASIREVEVWEIENDVGPALFVDFNAKGNNNGASWIDAFNDLSDAMTFAATAPRAVLEIWVAAGTYTPHPTGLSDPREATFSLINDVVIYGGFPSGGGDGTFESRDPHDPANETLLSGDLNGDDGPDFANNGDNCYHVVTGGGTDATAILDGFTITRGNADRLQWGGEGAGGGMFNVSGSPTLRNCTLSLNWAYFGGGMYNENSSPTVTNCTVSNNSGYWDGGGIYCIWESNLNITNCKVTRNSTGGEGGGIYTREGATAMITNCTIENNFAGDEGGGICNDGGGPLVVVSCKFLQNYTSETGGGIVCDASTMTVTNCVFTGNKSNDAGGAAYCDNGSNLGVRNCTFCGNSAPNGGGIVCDASTTTLTNCVFSGNKSGNAGGAVYCDDGSNLGVKNCTFCGNSAPNGRALACDFEDKYPSTLEVSNCILWDGANEIWERHDSTIMLNYSDVQGGWPVSGNIESEPCFANSGYWADANDPNIIVEPNDPNAVWIDGDYHLLEDSPCIDSGDPNYVPDPNETDLDGNPRVLDGDNDGIPVIDMGAYELVKRIEVTMRLTPQVLNCRSQGKWVKAHFILPEGYVVADVDADRPAVLHSFGFQSAPLYVFVNKDNLVEIEASFERQVLCSIAGDLPDELTVAGFLTDGNIFLGTSTVRIIHPGMKVIEELAWYWLNEDCVHPDFCNDIDMNRDSLVNLADYALLMNINVEFVTDE